MDLFAYFMKASFRLLIAHLRRKIDPKIPFLSTKSNISLFFDKYAKLSKNLGDKHGRHVQRFRIAYRQAEPTTGREQ